MFLLKISIVIITFVSYLHAIVPFEFKCRTREEYCKSIGRFRNQLATRAVNIPGVRILPENPEQITRIQLENGSGDVVHLVMQNKNLYIVGFITGGIFFRLKGHEDVNIDIVPTELNLKSNYVDLARAGQKSLKDIEVDIVKMNHCITTLFKYGNGGTSMEELAKALMGLSIAIPESLRFSLISSLIYEAMWENRTFQLNAWGVRHVNKWASYSEYATHLENDREAAQSYINLIGQRGVISRIALFELLAIALFCRVQEHYGHFISENPVCLPNIKPANLIVENAFWSKDTFILIFFT